MWFQSDHERFLAAIAAALLGAQGSPVWTRAAEALLLDDPQVKRQYQVAACQVEAALRDS